MEEKQNESDIPEITLTGGHRVRDMWTVRIVGCVVGALIPLLLILIPVVNKYVDIYKDITIVGIQSDVKYLKERVLQLENELRLCREHFYTTPKKIGFKN